MVYNPLLKKKVLNQKYLCIYLYIMFPLSVILLALMAFSRVQNKRKCRREFYKVWVNLEGEKKGEEGNSSLKNIYLYTKRNFCNN